ncbi:MAG: BLUF domain-containing protein [Phenylobacterium sp.]|uniref:BLUF domain-containing protein n=1 Tax=Brevundimonas sp. TaxID=1871086 RepID=UPI0027379959|nr:BLUF domain-containing protein [Brevundimonas sp.]MDP3802810.1 BLUF domain-containing protein [Brevundimonas sp.]MDZ4375479.1 BLUF domain-containing protein [Phenylobacterium sp.]
MLHRVIYASEAVGATGASTLSIAQILGVSERNNRRDHVTGCLMFHEGHILQALEGARGDLDRLMRRILTDPRHTGVRILSDMPVAARLLPEPMGICGDPAALLERIGLPCISRLTAAEAEALLSIRKAA